MQMADKIQLRRDTSANWTSTNPVLALAEIGIETNTSQFKVGDGTTAWSSLAYGGIQGPQGDTGATGATGPQGIQGDPGEVTFSGAQTLSNKTLATPTITGTPIETIFAITGTTPAISAANGSIQTWTLTGNSTPTGSISAGQAVTIMIDDGSAYTINWTSMAVTWVNNAKVAPALATTGYTVVVLWKVSTTLYGSVVGTGA
jgi:hypothetical protein